MKHPLLDPVALRMTEPCETSGGRVVTSAGIVRPRIDRLLAEHRPGLRFIIVAACAELGAQYHHTKPRTPQTNGMVERFNGRISSKVLAITVYSHDQLEQLLHGFNAAYNARRQPVLEGQTPDQVVAKRLTAKLALAKAKPSGQAGPCDIIKARLIAESEGGLTTGHDGGRSALLGPWRAGRSLWSRRVSHGR